MRGSGWIRRALQPASPAPGPGSATAGRRHDHGRDRRPDDGENTAAQGPGRT